MLITTFHTVPNVHLDLSFMKIKQSAKKIPHRARIKDCFRKEVELTTDEGINFAPPPVVPERFMRRKNR